MFANVFDGPFKAVFGKTGGVTIPWYRAGGAPQPICVYVPKGAASLAASYVNLITPGTLDAALGIAPTFDASGWVFNGISQYLTTVVPNETYSVLVRFSDAPAANGKCLLGYLRDLSSTAAFLIQVQGNAGASPNNSMGVFSGTGANSAYNQPTMTSGVYAIAGKTPYRDGITEAITIPAGTGGTWDKMFIGALYYNSAMTIQYFSGKIQAVAIWDTSTDHATWMPAVSAAVALI